MIYVTPFEAVQRSYLTRCPNILHFLTALDGGGARGRITIEFLARLELAMGSDYWMFNDLLSGTSTGAIIAGILACGVKATVLRDWYHGMAKYWQKNWLPPFPLKPIYKKDVIKGAIGELIGNTRMGDVSTRLMITSVDLCSDDNVYFKSWKDEHKDVRVVDAIERSFSAAVYFGSTPVQSDQKVYADGGEGNGNCPLMETWIEGKSLGWKEEGMYILSLGTGCGDETVSFKTASGYSPAFGQTKEYIGMAERQSVRTQMHYAEVIKEDNNVFDFCRVDSLIPDRLNVMAGYDLVNDYQTIGAHLADHYLESGGILDVARTISKNQTNYNRKAWLEDQYRKTQGKLYDLSNKLTAVNEPAPKSEDTK